MGSSLFCWETVLGVVGDGVCCCQSTVSVGRGGGGFLLSKFLGGGGGGGGGGGLLLSQFLERWEVGCVVVKVVGVMMGGWVWCCHSSGSDRRWDMLSQNWEWWEVGYVVVTVVGRVFNLI